MLPPGHRWSSLVASHQPGRWYYVGAICVAHVGPDAQGQWRALVDRHLDGQWKTAKAADREAAMRWVERWAEREAGRLDNEVARMRIGPDGWPVPMIAAED